MSGFIECSAATGVLKINNNMSNLPSLWVTHRTQYLVFLILSAIILGMTATVGYSPDAPFRRFLGKIDPLLSMTVAVLAGLLCFTLLLERGWRKIYEPKKEKAIWGFLGLTVFLAFNSIWIDSILVFPQNINILWPASLLFYPAIAFFVEILFHIIPLTLLTGLCYLFFIRKSFPKVLLGGHRYSCLIGTHFPDLFYGRNAFMGHNSSRGQLIFIQYTTTVYLQAIRFCQHVCLAIGFLYRLAHYLGSNALGYIVLKKEHPLLRCPFKTPF
jgi:hypothetical protein